MEARRAEDDADRAAIRASAGERLALIAHSFARLTGGGLADWHDGDAEAALWSAPRAIVAHGTEPVPLFFYANRLALTLFAMRAADFIGLPSFRSAEPGERDERARMFARLEADDVIDDYSGIRIAADGRRFRIESAHVWNLVDEAGIRRGQAASFSDWRYLEG